MKRKLHAENSPKAVFFLTSILVVITFVPFYFYPDYLSSFTSSYQPHLTSLHELPTPNPTTTTTTTTNSSNNSTTTTTNSSSSSSSSIIRLLPEECNLFSGEWVPNPRAPYYSNGSCWAIHDHQNCIKNGRPDKGFLQWRWKPRGCDLPIFNPSLFLDLVAGKSMAFVGDSIARNQMQSLMCLLTRVTYPIELYKSEDEQFTRFFYPKYNFTIANYWTAFLVRSSPTGTTGEEGPFHLHVDEPDPRWATQISSFDYVIISSGPWYFRPNYFYERNQLVGCHWCRNSSVADTTPYYGFRRALRSSLTHLNNLSNYTGVTFVRTYSPSHFENGKWDEGGDCPRTSPMQSGETRLDGSNLQMYMTQLEEFQKAKEVGEKKGLKYHFLDVTTPMLLRPDGHPSRYGHPANSSSGLKRDCVHWCLPGPIDSWNDFLLEIMKRERLKEAARTRASRKVMESR